MKRHAYTKTRAYGEESRIFYVALFALILVVSSYMYFVSLSVVNVVMRKEVDAEIRNLTTAVGELEAQYIERQHAVSSDIAEMKGFVVAEHKIFIDKAADTLVLRSN